MSLEHTLIDDYGAGHYACHYTGKPVHADAVAFVGALVPGVKAKYVCSDISLHRDSRKAFDECERNCNTCANLVRVKHDKCRLGFLQGNCDGKPIKFHPDDPMHMECWVARN